MNRDEFIRALLLVLENSHLQLEEHAVENLYVYYRELFVWNDRINLISRKDEDRFMERHLVDSLCVLKLNIERGSALLDIGSGNGLPGIPLAIARPDVRVELLEARQKRCAFLQHVVSRLKLENTKVHCGRLEELHGKLGRYHYILARGVKVTKGMATMIQGLLEHRGALVLYRGREGSTTEENGPSIGGAAHEQGRRLTIIRDVMDFEGER
jgi:16S rRNA (guanine527-N7)-methyltransferase